MVIILSFGKILFPVDRPISGGVSRQKLTWNRTCSIRASFWRQFLVPEKWRQKPRSHRQVFCRKKLATETCARNLPVWTRLNSRVWTCLCFSVLCKRVRLSRGTIKFTYLLNCVLCSTDYWVLTSTEAWCMLGTQVSNVRWTPSHWRHQFTPLSHRAWTGLL